MERETKRDFQLVGAVQYVQYQRSEVMGPTLTFDIDLGVTVENGKVQNKPTVILSFKTDHMNYSPMLPIADNPLWGYIPGWYFSPKLASNYLTTIIQTDVRQKNAPGFQPCKTAEDHLAKVGRSIRPFRNTLHSLFLTGRLGGFTCHYQHSPQLKGGGKIYGLVVDSCKVYLAKYISSSNKQCTEAELLCLVEG